MSEGYRNLHKYFYGLNFNTNKKKIGRWDTVKFILKFIRTFSNFVSLVQNFICILRCTVASAQNA